jgi:hypothetical protein
LQVRADDEQPTDSQLNAFKYLLANQRQILDASLDAIAKWGRKTRHVYAKWNTDEKLAQLLPRDVNPSQLMDRVRLYNIHICNRELKSVAYVEYSFGCCWDAEHGILVVLLKDRQKFCGFTGSGW